VISNAGLLNTYNKLLPQGTLSASPQMQQQLQQAAASGTSPAVVVLYLGLNEPLVKEFQGFGTLRVYPSADHDGNYAKHMADPDAPSAIIEICCHDSRERIMTDNPAGAAAAAAAVAAGSSGSSTVQVIVGANYSWFEEWAGTKWHHRGEGYEAFKRKLQDRLMQKLGEWQTLYCNRRAALLKLLFVHNGEQTCWVGSTNDACSGVTVTTTKQAIFGEWLASIFI
jgi:hypothetical protein